MKLFIPVLLSISAFASICLVDDDTRMSDGLRVLNQRVGTWKTETVTKPGVWVPEGGKSTGVETIEWSLGNKFLKGESKGEGPQGKGTNLHLMTYDEHEGVYRFWYFDSSGAFPRGETTGKYDENSKTITFKSNLANDISVDITMLFVNNDKVTWHGEWKNGDGQIMLEIDGTVTRIKEKKAEK